MNDVTQNKFYFRVHAEFFALRGLTMEVWRFMSKFAIVMADTDSYIIRKRWLISLVCTFLITYPNMMWIPWNLSHLENNRDEISFWASMVFRCGFFFCLFYAQLGFNIKRLGNSGFLTRFGKNFLFSLIGGIVFMAISSLIPLLEIQPGPVGKYLLFQFIVVTLICTFIGHIANIDREQRRKEQEIERLKIENLESRCNALTNQINPHFFFNSLNGISSLVRRGDEDTTLGFVTKLSDIFRYILQSDQKQLVTLADEIRFVEAFSHVMQVRFGGKLTFNINIGNENMDAKLPVLSLLPLLENVTTHNRIDSDHKMTVDIRVADNYLVVSNPIFPKICKSETTGTGLKNLQRRFGLLTGKNIEVSKSDIIFTVKLPL